MSAIVFNACCVFKNHHLNNNMVIETQDNVVFPPIGNCTQERTNEYYANIKKKVYNNWGSELRSGSTNSIGCEKITKKSVGIEFAIDKNGDAASINITASSGEKALDDMAIQAIKKSVPFERIPECTDNNVISIKTKFKYTLVEHSWW